MLSMSIHSLFRGNFFDHDLVPFNRRDVSGAERIIDRKNSDRQIMMNLSLSFIIPLKSHYAISKDRGPRRNMGGDLMGLLRLLKVPALEILE